MKKTLYYLYYISFIIVFLVLIDTILTNDQESFSILTNKAINIIIYCLVLLLFTHLIIKTKKMKNEIGGLQPLTSIRLSSINGGDDPAPGSYEFGYLLGTILIGAFTRLPFIGMA